MTVRPTLLAVLMAAAVFGAEAGTVYKWVDADGRAHYSDTPRPGWTPVEMKSGTSFAAGDRQRARDAEAQAAEGDDEAQAAASRAALRATECARRKEQLATYTNASTLVERDALGREKRYSEEERLDLIQQTQRQVAELCGEES